MPRTHASPFSRPPKRLVTAWNPLGEVCTLAHNTSRSDDLLQRLVATGGVVAEVLRTTPPDRSWIEDTIVFSGQEVNSGADAASIWKLKIWRSGLLAASYSRKLFCTVELMP